MSMFQTSFDRHSGRRPDSGGPSSHRDRSPAEAIREESECCGKFGCETRGGEGRQSRPPHESHSEALAARSFQFSGILPSGEGASLGYNGRSRYARLLTFKISDNVLIRMMSTSDATHKMHHVVSSY